MPRLCHPRRRRFPDMPERRNDHYSSASVRLAAMTEATRPGGRLLKWSAELSVADPPEKRLKLRRDWFPSSPAAAGGRDGGGAD
mmetsp:Transcript_35468/g.105907  ORF Transcript_35468/g.105907 Transcript_35468/m.105907 type:complete len:84 (+) Transcript_35468:429-680(+)